MLSNWTYQIWVLTKVKYSICKKQGKDKVIFWDIQNTCITILLLKKWSLIHQLKLNQWILIYCDKYWTLKESFNSQSNIYVKQNRNPPFFKGSAFPLFQCCHLCNQHLHRNELPVSHAFDNFEVSLPFKFVLNNLENNKYRRYMLFSPNLICLAEERCARGITK